MIGLVAALLSAASLAGASAETPNAQFVGDGRVIAVDAAAGTVTLDHGPIPGLMPPMRMRFSVLRRADLRTLKAGDLVRFSLGSRGDEITIVTIERVDEAGQDRR